MKTELLKQVSGGDSKTPCEELQGFLQKSTSMLACSNIDAIIKSRTQQKTGRMEESQEEEKIQ